MCGLACVLLSFPCVLLSHPCHTLLWATHVVCHAAWQAQVSAGSARFEHCWIALSLPHTHIHGSARQQFDWLVQCLILQSLFSPLYPNLWPSDMMPKIDDLRSAFKVGPYFLPACLQFSHFVSGVFSNSVSSLYLSRPTLHVHVVLLAAAHPHWPSTPVLVACILFYVHLLLVWVIKLYHAPRSAPSATSLTTCIAFFKLNYSLRPAHIPNPRCGYQHEQLIISI